MFTLFHTLQNYQENFRKEKMKSLLSLMGQITFILSYKNDEIYKELYKEFRRLEIDANDIGLEKIESSIEKLCKKARDNYDESESLILSKIGEIERINKMKVDDTETKKKFVEKAFYFAFHDQIINLCFEKGPKVEVYTTEDTPEIELSVLKESNKITFSEKENSVLFKDVTFLQTVAFLEFGEIVRYADCDDVPEHIKDIVYKIEKSGRKGDEIKFGIDSGLVRFEPAKVISEIISGEMDYDSAKNDFYYTKFESIEKDEKENEKKYKQFSQTYRARNTASGIKAFGVIQMLSNYGFMKAGNLLIIDEPEAHLHPMWQILYAELLVRIRKETGITILLSTHSTYFIEALKVYSENYGIENQTNFYFASKDSMFSSEIEDVTEDLEIIYETLSMPFEKLDEIEMNFKC